MGQEMDIRVRRKPVSSLPGVELKDLPFGKVFTDHMLVADYADGEWGNVEIVPYGDIQVSPALSALHYGQSFFEGIKAFRSADGAISIFRPDMNLKRFNGSARRLEMPTVPEELFIGGMKRLIDIDRDWVPDYPDHSLYIRPFMFATQHTLGVRPSETYRFMVILSPSGPIFPKPMRIYVEEHFVRAVPGGIGFTKAAANYGASMHPTAEANKKGFDQVLWTDPFEHKWVQEIGMMNVLFVIGDRVVTPDLGQGTILAGVTRDSLLTILRESGIPAEERPISIDELVEAYDRGELKEVFGAGTAATVLTIQELAYRGKSMVLAPDSYRIAPFLKQYLTDIRGGRKPDTHGWLMPV
jgi:branched-chain amino acid aminotransferase